MSGEIFGQSGSAGTSPQIGSLASEDLQATAIDQLPNEDFDALIDLLATDSPHDEALREAELDYSGAAHNLRNDDGRLDFGKIRTYFSRSSGGRD